MLLSSSSPLQAVHHGLVEFPFLTPGSGTLKRSEKEIIGFMELISRIVIQILENYCYGKNDMIFSKMLYCPLI